MADAQFLERLRQKVAAQGIARNLGLELEEAGPGYARVSMTCQEEMGNILGMVHGTAVFALMDEAFQVAVNAHGTVAVALQMSLTFHAAPTFGQRLTAVAREINTTRRTASCDIQVTDPGGRLIATCQALAYRRGTPLEW
jgi:acyl-CoA thioesterase